MKLVTGLLTLIGLILAAVVWAFWGEAGLDLFHALGTEDSPKTWISSSLLVASSTAAALVGVQNTRSAARYGWYLIALGLLGMAADDRFMGYERLKEWLYYQVFHADPQRMGLWGDAPLLIYGLGGLLTVWWLFRQPQVPYTSKRLLVVALLVGCLAMGLDIAMTTLWSQTIENVLEIVAETLFLGALMLSVLEKPSGTAEPPQVQKYCDTA